jgi:hypothetical protein
MYALGYRNFSIYGMDCSFQGEDGSSSFRPDPDQDMQQQAMVWAEQKQIMQWAGAHAGKRQELCASLCDGEIFISSPVLVTYAGGFFDIMNRLPNTKYRVYGDGLLPAMCRLYSSHNQLEAA